MVETKNKAWVALAVAASISMSCAFATANPENVKTGGRANASALPPYYLNVSTDKQIYSPGEVTSVLSKLGSGKSMDYLLDWCKTFPGPRYKLNITGIHSDYAKLAEDDGYMYMAGGNENKDGDFGIIVYKFSQDGTEIWNRTWDSLGLEYPHNLIQYNGILYVVGHAGKIPPNNSECIFLLAYDPAGNELWNRTFNDSGEEGGAGITAVGDALYISGSTMSLGAINQDVLLLKFNLTTRIFEWHKLWNDGRHVERGREIISLNNSLYVTFQDYDHSARAGLLKFDLDGNAIWARAWGQIGSASAIATDGERRWAEVHRFFCVEWIDNFETRRSLHE